MLMFDHALAHRTQNVGKSENPNIRLRNDKRKNTKDNQVLVFDLVSLTTRMKHQFQKKKNQTKTSETIGPENIVVALSPLLFRVLE